MDMETVKTSTHATDLDDELLDNALAQITSQPKRQYTQQEIDEARGNLALMNDRVFMVTFCDNKNNSIITGIVNALRKIHALDPIPPIERTTIQNVSLLDVLGRGMIGDLPKEYHDLWDVCCIFRTKTKDLEEVAHMQTITNPTALELLEEVKKTVAPNDFVNEALDRKSELEQLRNYVLKEKARGKAEGKAEGREEAKKEYAQKNYEEKLESAKKLIEMGLTDDQISKAMKIKIAEVVGLRSGQIGN